MVLSPPQPVFADHSPDLHVHLVVDGVTKLDVLIVDSVPTVRQTARLKQKKRFHLEKFFVVWRKITCNVTESWWNVK